MSQGFNKVILKGNLTRQFEAKYTPTGKYVQEGGIAVNWSYNDKDGKKVEGVDFINLTIWGKENLTQYLTKGKELLVEGRVKSESWEKDGQKHYKTYVLVDSVTFCGGKGDSSAPVGENEDGAGAMPNTEDEIPF